MTMQSEEVKKEKDKLGFLKKYLVKKVVIGIVILLVIIVGIIGLGRFIFSESRTTKIGFENIGELATQTAYCTELNVTDSSRDFFGVAIPFTQSKYIYSYDIAIKAGFNFEEIEWKINGTKIEVKFPEAKILSSDINMDSFKIYEENESIFNQITMTENNEAIKKLKQTAEEDAVANGLLENARANAEIILTSFFGGVYNLEKYEIIFEDK